MKLPLSGLDLPTGAGTPPQDLKKLDLESPLLGHSLPFVSIPGSVRSEISAFHVMSSIKWLFSDAHKQHVRIGYH
jgi:hypothetical protein